MSSANMVAQKPAGNFKPLSSLGQVWFFVAASGWDWPCAETDEEARHNAADTAIAGNKVPRKRGIRIENSPRVKDENTGVRTEKIYHRYRAWPALTERAARIPVTLCGYSHLGLSSRATFRPFANPTAGRGLDMNRDVNSFPVISRAAFLVAVLILIVGGFVGGHYANAAESASVLPDPAVDAPRTAAKGKETAVVAGGCFWGVQAVFQHVKGVKDATSGYSGGSGASPSYEQGSTGGTGHAEPVKITFVQVQVSYGELLKVFFSVTLDPT